MRLVILTLLLTAAVPAWGQLVVRTTDADDDGGGFGGAGNFPLVAGGRAAPIVVSPDDHRVVHIAAACLAQDIERVTARKPAILDKPTDGPCVIIGTLDRSPVIRRFWLDRSLELQHLRGRWETFQIARAGDDLVIVGSDRRGTAFGAFELSRAIGVSPWTWWADVPPRRRDTLYIGSGYGQGSIEGPPSVRYRGIFLNDEDWGLQPWAAKTFEPETGDIGPKTYAKIFELLLRLKANLCWPAMHPSTKAFNADPRNKQLADDYAIVMGSSHAEPMLRNNVGEWPHDQADRWNPVTNLPAILDYWETRVRENGKFESVYTLGMRGVHDSGMPGGGTPAEKRERLEKIILLQRDMLARHVNKDVEQVPQIFCPYKEVLDLYRDGLNLPDDITLVWPDDNFGHIRQLSDPRERRRFGRSGVYYHLSYNGRPHDYLWLESIPPALIGYEMTKAFQLGADRLWVVNVGDIKPAEAGMTLFLELAWDINRYGPDVQRTFLRDFYREQFGEEHADQIADVKRRYFRLCALRKPETLGWNRTYPNTPVRDGELTEDEQIKRFLDWTAVTQQTELLAGLLRPEQQAAYFQLVQYPAAAAAAMTEKMVFAERSRVLAARGDTRASGFADRAAAAHERIQQLTARYNEQLDGKWRHMMSATPRELPVFDAPNVTRIDAAAPTTTTRTAATTTSAPSQAPPMVEVDLRRPVRSDPRWVFLDGVGRSGGAITVLPRLAVEPTPVNEYSITAPGADGVHEFVVEVDALPTQPLSNQNRLVCGLSFDGGPMQTVSFEQGSDERDSVWQQNVLRNAMTGRTTAQLRPGEHVLRLFCIDPSVAVQRIALSAAPASQPATFSKKLPEGNYLVTVTFGRDDAPSETTVKAESRRLMLERVGATAGESPTRTFAVNIRTPRLPDGKEVKLNDREKASKTWDDQLSLEFLGPTAAVRNVEVAPAPPGTITLYIAGDSTVTDQAGEPWARWGQMLPRFFTKDVAVANHAESGRALRSFRSERRFDKILSSIKTGDWLFIQFGHNDMKEQGEGVGAFTSYKSDLKQYINAARDKGANVVVVTSMHRRRFEGDTIVNTFGDYIEAARQAAAEEKVPLIDLNAMSKRLYEAWGPNDSKKAFAHYPAGALPGQKDVLKDDTHHNGYGAYELARCVVQGIRDALLPLAEHLVDDVKPFDPAKPDPVEAVTSPASAFRPTVTREGR